MKCSKYVVGVLLVGSFLTSAPVRADVIVPSAVAGVEGNSNNGFPFNIALFGLPSQRYQQVYAASEFSGPILIGAIAFRPDTGAGAAFSSTLPSVRIDLSTTSAGPDALSPTFASNVGGDNLTVFSGPLSLSSAFTGPIAGPKTFDIVVNLTTPFFYNPAFGNLLMDVRNFGGGSTTQFDAQTALDSTSRVYSLGGGVASPTGDVSTDALVTKFAAVPEPGTLILLGAGLIGLGGWRSRRR